MTARAARHPACHAAVALLAAAVAAPAAQAQSSPWYVGVSQTFSRESNLIRLRDGQALPAGLVEDDSVSTTALVAGIDQRIGRQRVSGSGSLRDSRYRNNGAFDSRGYSGKLTLDWETLADLSGSAGVVVERAQRADLRDRFGRFIVDGNLESSRRLSGSARYGFAGPLSVEFGGSYAKVQYSSASAAYAEYTQDALSAAVRYRLGGATSVALGLRRTDIDYPNLLVQLPDPRDKRRRDDVDLTLQWLPSGASRLDLRLSQGRTRYEQFSERDFRGATGALGWSWQASGRTRLELRASRDTGQNSDLATTAFSQLTDSLRAGADYSLSAKVGAGLSAQWYRRKLDGSGQFVSGITGSDRGTVATLALRYAPLRSLTLGCQLQREQRGENSNPVLRDKYSASSTSCYGQFVLQ
jgi:hypothetical protein